MTDTLSPAYDVVVIGGGPAGLNGALMLARSRRTVAVIDAGHPRNAPAHAIHGLLGHDGTPPAELLERGRAEVRGYGGHVVSGEVIDAARTDDGFTVTLADGRTVLGATPARHHRPHRRAARHCRSAGPVGPGRPALPVLPRLGGA